MLLDNENKCADPNPDFVFDEACLDVNNFYGNAVTIWGQYEECDKCDYQPMVTVGANSTTSLLINTKYSMQMHYEHNGSIMCDWKQDLLEHYRYSWNLTTDKCNGLFIKESADSAYIPILTAFIILFCFGTMWYMIKGIYKCTKSNAIWRRLLWYRASDMHNDLGSTSDTPLVIERAPAVKKHPNRIKAIDVFRGLCIIVMIFVNYGGGKYYFFDHSVWNGITIADLVFPWFMWIMGLSMSLSFNNKLRRAVPRRQLVIEVLRRSTILIVMGVVLNSNASSTPLAELRFTGVLQLLGVTYLIVGLLEAAFAKRTNTSANLYMVTELTSAWPQWIVMLSLVAIHTSIVFLAKVPGCDRGYLGPGGLQNGGKNSNCTGGVVGFIDRQVWGEHIYKKGLFKQVYETKQNFDPEGILAMLTGSFMVFLGVHAGRILNIYSNVTMKTIRWVVYGVVFGLLGGILCEFSKNGGPIPLNKHMWSLSFVFALGGAAFLVLAALFVLVDITRKWGGRPFFYPGMNPLLLYTLHVIGRDTFPIAWKPSIETHSAYLGLSLWGAAFWVCFSIFLYKRNIFISI